MKEQIEELIKNRLFEHYNENASEFDEEETNNVLSILEQYDDNLTGLSYWDGVLLKRLVLDDELIDALNKIIPIQDDSNNIFV